MRAKDTPSCDAAHRVKSSFRFKLSVAFTALCALWVGHARAADPYPGYTLFSTGTTAYLYNMKKEKVHEWKVAAGSVQTSTYLLPDGSMFLPLNSGGTTFRPAGALGSGTFQK